MTRKIIIELSNSDIGRVGRGEGKRRFFFRGPRGSFRGVELSRSGRGQVEQYERDRVHFIWLYNQNVSAKRDWVHPRGPSGVKIKRRRNWVRDKGGKLRHFRWISVYSRAFSYIFVLSLILGFKFASLKIVSLDLGEMDSLDLDWTSLYYIVYCTFYFIFSFSLSNNFNTQYSHS